jgi:hypothetical protein
MAALSRSVARRVSGSATGTILDVRVFFFSSCRDAVLYAQITLKPCAGCCTDGYAMCDVRELRNYPRSCRQGERGKDPFYFTYLGVLFIIINSIFFFSRSLHTILRHSYLHLQILQTHRPRSSMVHTFSALGVLEDAPLSFT